MIDPVEQDTNRYHTELANYNRAMEAMIPVVREERTVFDGFLRDEYPDLYDKLSEEDIEGLQSTLNRIKRTDPMTDKWNEHILWESKRRVDG